MKIQRQTFNKYLKNIKPNTVIFSEGDQGTEMYVIIDGEVEIRKTTSGSSTKTLIVLQKGDIFGEMSIIENKPRSATAVAMKDTQLLCMNEDLFESMLQKNSDFAGKIITMLSARLRRANTTIKSIMSTNKLHQVFSGLYIYAEKYGTATYKGYRANVGQFIEWAEKHLGISAEEIKSIIETLLHRKYIKSSALGKGEILIDKRR